MMFLVFLGHVNKTADIAKTAIVMGNIEVGHMEQWFNNKLLQESSLALAESISELKSSSHRLHLSPQQSQRQLRGSVIKC